MGLPDRGLWLAPALSLTASLLLVPLAQRAAARLGLVSFPSSLRWSRRAVPLLGGAALFLAWLLPLSLLVPKSLGQGWSVPACGALLFLLGLADDVAKLRPATKLLGQMIAAAAAAYFGHRLSFLPSEWANILASLFWIVAVSNAFNLIDNMDGLASGIAAVSCAFLAVLLLSEGRPVHALQALALLGAALGFLLYNFPPASIFMGDAGSLFLGGTIAILALRTSNAASFVAAFAVPMLVVLVPLLDVTLVFFARLLARRPVSTGGKDHSSHRLVFLGIPESRAVSFFYALAVVAGATSLWLNRLPVRPAPVLVPILISGFAILGIHLAQLRFSATPPRSGQGAPVPWVEPALLRRAAEVGLDALLAFAAYWLAYSLRFGFEIPPAVREAVLVSMPLTLIGTLGAFLAADIYRGSGQPGDDGDILRLTGACLLGTVLAVFLVVLANRFEGHSRAVFPLYGVLLLGFISARRLASRLLARLLSAMRVPGRPLPVLVYGGGAAVQRTLEALQEEGNCEIVGFIDEGSSNELAEIHRRTGFKQLILASERPSPERLRSLLRFCRSREIIVRELPSRLRELP